jgi:hypothetical protein
MADGGQHKTSLQKAYLSTDGAIPPCAKSNWHHLFQIKYPFIIRR